MENVIYGDILLVINFSMDFIALFLTSKIMHIKTSRKRLNISAISGGLYSLFTVMFPFGNTLMTVSGIIFSFVMMFIITGKTKISSFIKNTAVFYAVNFCLGGGITALANLFNMWQHKRKVYINGTYDTVYGSLPFGIFVFLSVICAVLSYISGKLLKRKKSRKTAELSFEICGKKGEFSALVDTGNLLCEPISERPVVLCIYGQIRKYLPPDVIPFVFGKNLPDKYPSVGIRAIPVSTASGNGIMFAVIPDKLTVNGVSADALIAIDTNSSDYGGEYALCPSVLC